MPTGSPRPLRMTAPQPPDPTEAVHQTLLFRTAALHTARYPELALMFHVPNGLYTSKTQGAAAVRQGVRKGVPDICLPVMRRGPDGAVLGALWVELKRLRSGTPTPEQTATLAALNAAGHRALLCRGWEAAWAAIIAYLALPKP